ncbi:MAG: helix-turn-helix domain-containing protein [Candidatus Thiodiazotropha sp. (ex Epidulcina cf. delphinae)]|nr:helix-turn-helix domain-containing protein [Candidatus Thiodiazotropha sp. (ex Epidulcina cf. delphinae)]
MSTQVQIIERDGKPEYAVVPIDIYKKLLQLAEDMEDTRSYDEAMTELMRGDEGLIPAETANRLLSGDEHPLKVWREFRGLTQQALADQAETTKAYISQIESGKKTGSVQMLLHLATALNVDMDDLVGKVNPDHRRNHEERE